MTAASVPTRPPIALPPGPSSVAPASVTAGASAPLAPESVPEGVDQLWSRVIDAADRAGNKRLRIVLDDMSLISLSESGAMLRVSEAMRAPAMTLLREITNLVCGQAGREVSVQFLAAEPAGVAEASPALTRPPVTDHPLVKQAMDLFGARVIRVQPRAER